jgi:2-polyprenyl-3-methyl-5-hydroxy-6-metoxy-1,4-benzoquinol methylase
MTTTATAPALDEQRLFAFSARLLDDMAGAMIGVLCALGDRLGLFTALAAGPVDAVELARRAEVDERYARDWLAALAARGYIEYEPGSARYSLPPEHAASVAHAGSPLFMGGAFEQLPGMVRVFEQVADAFRTGDGVPSATYGDQMRRAMERTSAGWFDHQLVQAWLAGIPGLTGALEAGAAVADIGCASGRALISIARAFPASRFTGFDIDQTAIAHARANAECDGVADRVSFQVHDVTAGVPGRYDLITMFDTLHDMPRPLEVARRVRTALRPDGTFLLLELQSSERTEDNVGPVAALLYSTSVMYCIPTSVAGGADGLGTLGLPEPRVRALLGAAEFSAVERIPVQSPFHALYRAVP